MRKLALSALLIAAALGAGCTRIGPGNVGIVMSKAGSNKGVSDIPATTGWVFYNPFATEVWEYPTFVKTAVWTKDPQEGHPINEEISFSTGDSMQVHADVSLAYQLNAKNVPAFYVMFRNDDLDTFTHGFLRNLARQKFDDIGGKYKIEQVMGDNGPFLKEVRESLQAELTPIGVELKQFGFIGSPRPPQTVIDSINSKVQATQIAIQKENEVRQAQAEAAKTVAQAQGYADALLKRSEAEAAANRKIAESLTPNLIEFERTKKWDGKLPQVTSSGGTLFTIK